MEISIKRISYLSSLGFIICLALACASSGCAASPDEIEDDGATDPVVPTEPGPAEIEPAAPSEEEPWCGLDAAVTPTDSPVFAEDWTNGYPFEAEGSVGYLDVVHGSLSTYLLLRVFGEDNTERSYSLSARLLSELNAYCDYYVHDVLVDGPRVYVLHASTCWSGTGEVESRSVELSTIDVTYGLSATYGHWQLSQEMYRLYQLALDGDVMLIGSYDVFSAEHAVRVLHRSNGLQWLGQPTVVSPPSTEWSFQRFIAFDAHDGLLTYKVADYGSGVRTIRYRACE